MAYHGKQTLYLLGNRERIQCKMGPVSSRSLGFVYVFLMLGFLAALAAPVVAAPGLSAKNGYLIPSRDKPFEKTLDWAEGRWIECRTKPRGRYYDVISYKVQGSRLSFIYRDGELGSTNTELCREALLARTNPSRILNIEHVKQQRGKLCGLAVLESIFRFHGIRKYDQYRIGKELVTSFRDVGRYKNSSFVQSGMTDWSSYPGTGTYYMRNFMKKFTKVQHRQIKSYPRRLEQKVRNAFFYDLKEYVANGVPVVVHQKWSLRSNRGHYRIILDVSETRQSVALMDPRPGKITQSFSKFFKLWQSSEPWLSYTFLAYHVDPGQRALLESPLQIRF